MTDITFASVLSEDERPVLMARLYDLMSRQTTRYLAGDSTSIPVETAEELFRSILFTLLFAQAETGRSVRELLDVDLAQRLKEGQALLQDKLTAVHRLWEQACLTLPQIPNDYLQDTMKGIQGFFKHYDLHNFAHQIPCTMDYLLSVPVSESLQGVSYVEQWLKQLLSENWFLRRFQPQAVSRLLSQVISDYWASPTNLCEQPIINAVGLALLRRSVLPLTLSDEDCHALEGLLLRCDNPEATLNQGIDAVTAELHAPEEVVATMKAVLHDTIPRMLSARQYGSLKGIFV